MNNGASSCRRFLNGDTSGFVELVREYKDGLILYLSVLQVCNRTDCHFGEVYTLEIVFLQSFCIMEICEGLYPGSQKKQGGFYTF